MTQEPVLTVSRLTKRFGAADVLRDASLEVAAGTILGFVGPNGAGKSTCLRCLLGICFPDSGSVTIAGIDALEDPVGARAQTGYLPGENSAYGGMRGSDMLRFGLAFHRKVDRAIQQRCLERFRLPIERKVRTYSAGQKQLLALTLALSPQVPLYVLDEPDKALDASMRHQLRLILRELKNAGKALLVSSHHIGELEGIADDYAFVLDGRIISRERIDAERARFANQVRATFRRPPAGFSLPGGTTIERDEEDWIFTPEAGTEIEDVVRALLPLKPASLDYGHASLQEIYEALYLAKRR